MPERSAWLLQQFDDTVKELLVLSQDAEKLKKRIDELDIGGSHE